MGRVFNGTTDFIHCTGATFINGFLYTFGTVAVCVIPSDVVATGSPTANNNNSGAHFEIENASSNVATWDGSSFGNGATTLVNGTKYIWGMTKATGTATPRFHIYNFATNTWVHEDSNNTAVNSAALTSVTIGANGSAAGDPFNGEVFDVAWWASYVMGDLEFERLARGDWERFAADAFVEFDAGRQVGAMATSLGRFPIRQSSSSGTTRGTSRMPGGFRQSAKRRRR